MPITAPVASRSGPPLLPGLMAASVWIRPVRSSVVREPDSPTVIERSRPDTIPDVTVSVNVPSGLPMAMASSPTWSEVESASLTAGRPVAWILMTARSCVGSVLTTVAGSCRPSARVTVSVAAPEMTWLLVRISPFELTMKPDPVPPEVPKALAWSTDSIVTTDGLTRLTASTIACV